MKTIIQFHIYLIIMALPFASLAQTTKELHGRVVEMSNGKTSGIGNIMVSIKDFSYNLTNNSGEFLLQIPADKEYVKINLENTNRQLIAPYAGLINLPPAERIEIVVCAQENQRLKGEVDKLNKKVKSFQVKYELSEKKAANAYQEMLDTILFYEQRIQNLDSEKVKIQNDSKSEIQRLQLEIDRLKMVEESLMKQLLEAKDEKFKKKQAIFQRIATGLRHYDNELQNLRDMILPERIPQYFAYNNKAAGEKLTERIYAYNAAFDEIINSKDGNLTEVRHYWEDETIVAQLTETYQFLLEDVHKKSVLPIEFTINDALKKYASRELGRQQAEKIAKASAIDAVSKIKVKTTPLSTKINESINLLKQNF